MFNINNTILIVGDSPFLESIQDKVSYAIDKFVSMGINNIIKKYPVKYHVFQDIPFCLLTNKYPEICTVAPYAHGDLIQKDKKELYDSYTFNFKGNSEGSLYKDGKLAWCGFTHDYAISYCIMKGYKNIVLIGAADFTKGKHFMTESTFNPSAILTEQSKKFIENVCTKKANMYTCNPESYLNIPRLNIDELLA